MHLPNAKVQKSNDLDLPAFWSQLNEQIARIESRYPLILTTLITVFLGILAAKDMSWFSSFSGIAPYLVPVLIALGMTYVSSLYRQVAVLRGYCAYIEDEINSDSVRRTYLWNSKYIDRFEQNNAPNILLMSLTGMLLIVAISAVASYLSSKQLWSWLIAPKNAAFVVVMSILLLLVIFSFTRNDSIRRRAYEFARLDNHADDRPHVCVYPGSRSIFDKSGIGRARKNHRTAAELAGVRITTDTQDPYYKVLHVSSWNPGALWTSWRARKRGRRVVVSTHSCREDFLESVPGSSVIAPIFAKWLRLVYSQADHLLIPSTRAELMVQSLGISVPATIVSGGVDISVFSPNRSTRVSAFAHTPARGRIHSSDKVVLGIGYTFRRKGYLDFVRVARSMPDVKFIWMGPVTRFIGGPKVLWNVVRRPENLVLVGYVSNREKVARIMNACDAFLGLSHEETEGLAVLECLASGLPSVLRSIDSYPTAGSGGTISVIPIDAGTDAVVAALRPLLNQARPLSTETEVAEQIEATRTLVEVGQRLKLAYFHED